MQPIWRLAFYDCGPPGGGLTNHMHHRQPTGRELRNRRPGRKEKGENCTQPIRVGKLRYHELVQQILTFEPLPKKRPRQEIRDVKKEQHLHTTPKGGQAPLLYIYSHLNRCRTKTTATAQELKQILRLASRSVQPLKKACNNNAHMHLPNMRPNTNYIATKG